MYRTNKHPAGYRRWLQKVVQILIRKYPDAYRVIVDKEGEDAFDILNGKVAGIRVGPLKSRSFLRSAYDLYATPIYATKQLVTQYNGKKFLFY